jgi:hypothetical protein
MLCARDLERRARQRERAQRGASVGALRGGYAGACDVRARSDPKVSNGHALRERQERRTGHVNPRSD